METLPKVNIKKVWDIYVQHHDVKSRNILLEHYLPLVKYAVERLQVRFPKFVDLEDLHSAGIFGLMGAIEKFDPRENTRFETYSAIRIQGAIWDYMREKDWVPRLVRTRTKKLQAVIQRLETILGRYPTDEELADELGMNIDQFYRFQQDANVNLVISLNTSSSDSDGDDELKELYVIPDPKSQNPFSEVHKQDFQEYIKRGLPRQEQLIIILYYFEELTMKEIGVTLGISESRVCQLHSAVIAHLKAMVSSSALCPA
ncbi:MAG: FliA/WhiG family RNA polymerase sigma factor [Sedimentisphaerales bacterium]|nr:FliA/WhiG family RNA polymerase sigma factor [Sedimentisphaerales bacterium]